MSARTNTMEEKNTEQSDVQEELETSTTSEETTEVESEEIDYDAELEAERKRGKPDLEIAKKAFKERQEKREEVDESDDDKPLTRKDLARIRDEARKEANADRIREIAESLAENPKQVDLIVEIHKNRGFPEGMTLKEQVEEAFILANRKRIQSKLGELTRAVASKETVSRDAASTHRDPMEGTAPRMSADDTAAYKRAGFEYNQKSKAWAKKLPNGKTLFKDSKTKRTWVE